MSEENKPDPEGEGEKDVEKAFAARLKSATSKYDERISDLEARLQQEREERIRLESATPSKKETPVYSRDELLEFVEQEKMTQAQADRYWEDQIIQRTKKEVLGSVTQIDSQKQINNDLREYKKLKPGISRPGHEDREKVSEEYSYLLSIGQPDSVSTELTAVRNVFGPVEKLKKKIEVETHQETGGGEPPPKEEHKVLKGMSQRQKDYYSKRVEQGIYKSWDEVEKELKYTRG
jgi:hypothetical protein